MSEMNAFRCQLNIVMHNLMHFVDESKIPATGLDSFEISVRMALETIGAINLFS